MRSREASVFPPSLPDLSVQRLPTWASSQRGKVAKIDLKFVKEGQWEASGDCILLKWTSLIGAWINCTLSRRSLSSLDSRDRWPRRSGDYLQHRECRKRWAAAFNVQNFPQAAAAQRRYVLYLVRNQSSCGILLSLLLFFRWVSISAPITWDSDTLLLFPETETLMQQRSSKDKDVFVLVGLLQGPGVYLEQVTSQSSSWQTRLLGWVLGFGFVCD